MKKRLFASLLIFPLLSGCYGNFITKDTAKARVANIIDRLTNEQSEIYVKDEDYALYNFKINRKYAIENYEQERFSELNLDELYYHEYVIQKTRDNSDQEWTYKVDEKWEYLKDEDDKFNYYHVSRTNGTFKEPVDCDVYNVKDNREKSWNIYLDSIKSEIRSQSVHSVEEVDGIIKLIEEDNGIAVYYIFRSLNDDSIYIDSSYTQDDILHYFEISIENLHVAIFKHNKNYQTYDEWNVEYNARVDRIEPDISGLLMNKNQKD